MKKLKEIRVSYIVFAVLSVIFCTVDILSAKNFYGRWYFALMTVLYSLGIIAGVLFLFISILELYKKELSFTHITLFIIGLLLIPLQIVNSVDYYKDLYNGAIEVETEIYEIPIESYYENFPDEQKYIGLFDDSLVYYSLDISDDTYFDLVHNNPLDETRTVYYSALDWEIPPHMHFIKAKFYENTGIVDDIQILYD